jgi:outer membrane protein assembly factor BamB
MTPTRVLPFLLLPLALAADWPQFRGPESAGVAPSGALPDKISPDANVAWKAEFPGRGPSCPIVVGGRVFLTSAGGPRGDQLHVLAFDAGTGKRLWQRGFWATGPTDCHPKSTMAAPTPASDGDAVVALFGTDDLVCLDRDGNVRWVRSLYEENPGATDGRGLATSPVIVGGTAVVHLENQNVSFALGVDLKTGKNRWRIDRPRELNWTTPIAIPGAGPGGELVLLQGATRLSACDPATGREVWGLDRASDPIASSVRQGNVLYVPGEKGLAAYDLQGNAPPKLLWEKTKLNPVTASPVVLDDRVYSLRQGVLVSGDLKTGEVVGQLRLKGPFSASPVVAGGLLYCFSETGVAQVIRPGAKEDTLVSSGNFNETVLATPAIADGAIYVRSDKHLWKITQP